MQRLRHHAGEPLQHTLGLRCVAGVLATALKALGPLRVDGKTVGGQPFELVVQKVARCGAFGKAVPRPWRVRAAKLWQLRRRVLLWLVVGRTRCGHVHVHGRPWLGRQVTRQAGKTRDRP